MRRTWAAAAVVLVLAGCATDAEPAAQPSSAPAPGEWRTEVWGDVQLEVPVDWTLGYAPMPNATGALECGVGPLEGGGEETKAYVGRPGYGSDVCLQTDLVDLGLDRAGVWFGSVLPVGEAIAKTGLHQVTVDAGSGRVTVASKDEAVLRRVLDSVKRVDEDTHGCPATPDVERSYPDEGYGEVQALAVCVYERDGGWSRLWTTALPSAQAEQLVEAVEGAEEGPPCKPQDTSQLVLLRVTAEDPMGDEPLARDLVMRPDGCASIQHWGTGGRWLRLAPELVRPWATPGVSTYVWSNGLPGPVARFFRSMWG